MNNSLDSSLMAIKSSKSIPSYTSIYLNDKCSMSSFKKKTFKIRSDLFDILTSGHNKKINFIFVLFNRRENPFHKYICNIYREGQMAPNLFQNILIFPPNFPHVKP